MAGTFQAIQERFAKLYKRRMYLHHYLQYMEQADIAQAVDMVAGLTAEYAALDCLKAPDSIPCRRPVGMSFI